jgi:hypothetical protein
MGEFVLNIQLGLFAKIPYLNPLKEIVINYQNGGDCKNMSFTPCVVLVIDDNPYGLTVALRINLRSSP